jgi:hypothetical protein
VQAAAALGAQVTDHDSALCSPLSGTFVGWGGDLGSAGQRSHKFSTVYGVADCAAACKLLKNLVGRVGVEPTAR